jgi:restriction system protein
MAVPDYQSFMRPLLLLASSGAEQSINDAINRLADEFQLSKEERSQLLPSGLGTVLANRVSWAKTYLLKAGALEKTEGLTSVSPTGDANCSAIIRPQSVLRHYESILSS